jgi:hypothetical protein
MEASRRVFREISASSVGSTLPSRVLLFVLTDTRCQDLRLSARCQERTPGCSQARRLAAASPVGVGQKVRKVLGTLSQTDEVTDDRSFLLAEVGA